ncbi:PREDICTED: arabinogalactan peptide 16 [Fragaria vesca subsp. vesca]|uniref:arabinogalactan peptide 16 n=1 Tax=Fragaria vesca subsp. vesca TaxID=101020 RepID=UPI0002C300FC|nr:PREDICTED: arabinogalactan peptide 16 [Fragaria vesca subsp. vesca]
MAACFGFSKAIFRVLAVLALLFIASASASKAPAASPLAAHAPAPAPAPISDGISIDQGIAYVLMLVALVLTYLIHPLDASSYNFF